MSLENGICKLHHLRRTPDWNPIAAWDRGSGDECMGGVASVSGSVDESDRNVRQTHCLGFAGLKSERK
jgi:hypothetical protein